MKNSCMYCGESFDPTDTDWRQYDNCYKANEHTHDQGDHYYPDMPSPFDIDLFDLLINLGVGL